MTTRPVEKSFDLWSYCQILDENTGVSLSEMVDYFNRYKNEDPEQFKHEDYLSLFAENIRTKASRELKYYNTDLKGRFFQALSSIGNTITFKAFFKSTAHIGADLADTVLGPNPEDSLSRQINSFKKFQKANPENDNTSEILERFAEQISTKSVEEKRYYHSGLKGRLSQAFSSIGNTITLNALFKSTAHIGQDVVKGYVYEDAPEPPLEEKIVSKPSEEDDVFADAEQGDDDFWNSHSSTVHRERATLALEETGTNRSTEVAEAAALEESAMPAVTDPREEMLNAMLSYWKDYTRHTDGEKGTNIFLIWNKFLNQDQIEITSFEVDEEDPAKMTITLKEIKKFVHKDFTDIGGANAYGTLGDPQTKKITIRLSEEEIIEGILRKKGTGRYEQMIYIEGVRIHTPDSNMAKGVNYDRLRFTNDCKTVFVETKLPVLGYRGLDKTYDGTLSFLAELTWASSEG